MLNRWCTCLLILLSSASFADAKSNPASTAHKNVPARTVVLTASESDKLEYEPEAAGAVLVAPEKYADTIPNLEKDDNPLSPRFLWKAYGSTGAGTRAEGVAAKLAAMKSTVEQALVVPQFRASLVSQPGQP